MTATDLKQLCGSAFRRSTFRLRRGRADAAEAPSKTSPGLYPETLKIRYRYQTDGSIVVVTPKGPRCYDDLTDFWSDHDPSSAANSTSAFGSLLPTSERRLRQLVIMLCILALVFAVHEIASDVGGRSVPQPAMAEADVEITGALPGPQENGETRAAKSSPGLAGQAPGTSAVADARGTVEARPLTPELVNADTQFAMGLAYEEGRGVSSNFIEAMRKYRVAAEQGHVTAQYHLGLMYGQGRGAPRDLIEAHKWMSLAASSPPASDVEPQGGAQSRAIALTPAQLIDAHRLVARWEQPAAGR